jgi:hypothetical protein
LVPAQLQLQVAPDSITTVACADAENPTAAAVGFFPRYIRVQRRRVFASVAFAIAAAQQLQIAGQPSNPI